MIHRHISAITACKLEILSVLHSEFAFDLSLETEDDEKWKNLSLNGGYFSNRSMN